MLCITYFFFVNANFSIAIQQYVPNLCAFNCTKSTHKKCQLKCINQVIKTTILCRSYVFFNIIMCLYTTIHTLRDRIKMHYPRDTSNE